MWSKRAASRLAMQYVKLLCKNKLVAHQSKPYESYRLTFKGYDYLAIKTMSKRGTLASMGIQIGVGKESDIFTVCTPEGDEACLKLHRLGRNCFRTVKFARHAEFTHQSHQLTDCLHLFTWVLQMQGGVCKPRAPFVDWVSSQTRHNTHIVTVHVVQR